MIKQLSILSGTNTASSKRFYKVVVWKLPIVGNSWKKFMLSISNETKTFMPVDMKMGVLWHVKDPFASLRRYIPVIHDGATSGILVLIPGEENESTQSFGEVQGFFKYLIWIKDKVSFKRKQNP